VKSNLFLTESALGISEDSEFGGERLRKGKGGPIQSIIRRH